MYVCMHACTYVCANVKKFKASAFVELLTHIEQGDIEGTFCFKFPSFRHVYNKHLVKFDITSENNKIDMYNTSGLKLSSVYKQILPLRFS